MATIRPDNSKIVKTKIVNINARIPVKTVAPPIYGVKMGIEMSISDILKCLTRRAIVHQVLSDGSTVQLTTKNFREDFEGQLKMKKAAEAKSADKKETTEPTIVTPEVESIKEVQIEDKPEPTGNIDDLNLADDIDDDDDDNSEEPEEASNTIVTREYIDGTKIDQVGVEPKFPEPVDDEDESSVAEAAEEKPEEAVPAEEVTESEETETIEEPVVSDEAPVSSSTKKKNNNSKKSGSKKK